MQPFFFDRVAAEEVRRQALLRVTKERHTRLKVELKKAIQLEDVGKLEPAVNAVKEEKEIEDCGELLAEAKKLLMKLRARRNLGDAVAARKLAGLERAVEEVRKGGFEADLRKEMDEAKSLLEKLRKLDLMRKAVMNLSQRVVAEIKSYSKPPTVVHTVMSATFLLLGSPEAESKSWQATQVRVISKGEHQSTPVINSVIAENKLRSQYAIRLFVK